MNTLKTNRAERLLPGVITSLEVQKKRRKRYSVFVEDEFLIGLSEAVLLEFKLEKGSRLDYNDYNKLRKAEEYKVTQDYFLRLLGRRDHTRKELLQKAFKKQINREVAELVLDEFEEKGWIDHTAFARDFIRDKFRLNRWGPRKIRNALQQKGVDRNLSDRLTNEYFESVELLNIFLKLIEKKSYKFKRIEDTVRRRKKVFDYLSRKGYHTQQILEHIDRLMETLTS